MLSVKSVIASSKRYQIGGREYSPEQIVSLIFAALKERSEQRFGQAVKKTVVSVPAYFDEIKRQAIKNAAAMPGLEVVLVDVTPLGLGIESGEEEFVTLLPRNTVLPARASAVFTTMSDFQRRARVTVLQGER
ncbi:MAG TPA: Hsp70 family protein, partial [Spirochaetia bacterium]|nr:Hsp70 family protein [Spirochaetia bacterium]